MAAARKSCKDCESICSPDTIVITLAGDLKDVKEKPKEFYKYINCLLNGKGGAVVIHAKNREMLEQFDQKVDKKLCDLISDGSLYHKVFKRSYFDKLHLVYYIEARHNDRRWSTLDFKTTTSVNKGKEKPSYEQMSVFLKELCASSSGDSLESTDEEDIEFKNRQQVFIKKDYGSEPFQESMTLQAKSLPSSKTLDLAKYCWESLKLDEYISAFTKIEGGGSVYFGVREHKDTAEMWKSASPGWITLKKMGEGRSQAWQIWQEQNLSASPTVYYVAKRSKTQETSTGKFMTEAIPLKKKDRELFRQDILQRVKNELLWFGEAEPKDPVKVIFHEVTGAPTDHCVIEVRIKYYHGLCFYDKEGPESYTANGTGKVCTASNLKRIPVSEWIESFNADAVKKMKKNVMRE